MARDSISVDDLTSQLRRLGVAPGGALVLHCSFSRVAPVANGPHGLIAALRGVLGPAGTLLMPSMSDDDEHPFDVLRTPCSGMGIAAETFRMLPGVSRSDSPHAFAAVGPHAAALTAPHPVEIPHGPDSPIGRAHELDAQVLLLGVGHDADTAIHLAEYLAGVRYRIPKHATVRAGGEAVRVAYDEIDHCCANFALMDAWLEERRQQRRGVVGHAEARLARAREVVATAVSRLTDDEAVFLHGPGACTECDQARASVPGSLRSAGAGS